jgi:hypothetical protein
MSAFSPWRAKWATKRKEPELPPSQPRRSKPTPAIVKETKPLELPSKPLPQPLPVAKPVHGLVGQDANMQRLLAWFNKPNYRLAVLWGVPGVGKTMAAYALSADVIEFSPMSTNVGKELTRALLTLSVFGKTVVLLDDVDTMSKEAHAGIERALLSAGRSPINPLVVTCASLHLLPDCLKLNALVLHFARLQPVSIYALLNRAGFRENQSAIADLAYGDARQALILAENYTPALGKKDLCASPFQMVHAAMNRSKLPKPCKPPPIVERLSWKESKLTQVWEPTDAGWLRFEEGADFPKLYEDFEASIFAFYLVWPAQKTAQLLKTGIWHFEQDFVDLAPELSDWRVMFEGLTLAQDVQSVAMHGVPALFLKMVMEKSRSRSAEVKEVSGHTAVFHRTRWDPHQSYAEFIKRANL